MYVKPTDLGPIYKEPILAQVYITAVESYDELLNFKEVMRLLKSHDPISNLDNYAFSTLAMNIYIHNRL